MIVRWSTCALVASWILAVPQPGPERDRWIARSTGQYLPQHLDAGSLSVASTAAGERATIRPVRNQRSPQPTLPVLEFPEPGIDDTTSYQGYQTRFYRDSKQNTIQIYLEPRGGRVVHVLANGANESVGFTVRDSRGRPARVTWYDPTAHVADSGAVRTLEYRLVTERAEVELGWFLLGSMRVERDFVYAGRHLEPYTSVPFVVAEESLLVAGVGRLPEDERAGHLTLLRATSLQALEARLQPALTLSPGDTASIIHAERPSLDGRNRMWMEIRVDPRRVKVEATGRTVRLRTRPGARITLAVKIATDASPLSPLSRQHIFSQAYLTLLRGYEEQYQRDRSPDLRRIERQVRAVELLSSKEKLMAGLPNFATYFGRDMMMTALMMRPIWSPEMSEHVIASVLRKLGPGGEVSHEEALGGQAIRENAVTYDSLLGVYSLALQEGRSARADSSLIRARAVLRDLQATRENYHMIDDEFQLPVLAARYLSDASVPAERKRAFLAEPARGSTHLALLLKELDLVARQTRPYVEQPSALNLVSFPKRDSIHWRSASWRDSDAGYAGGRFAMDVNAIWVPHALKATSTILATLSGLGVAPEEIERNIPAGHRSVLGSYARAPDSLTAAIAVWEEARRHFEVSLSGPEAGKRIAAKLAWLPKEERAYWSRVVKSRRARPVSFLALSLDSAGTPIPVMNTDPATGLFLEDFTSGRPAEAEVLRDVSALVLAYPYGLLVHGLGPLAANDAYASREVWERFRKDQYHGPRVVWGREVNLLQMGLANQIRGAFSEPGKLKDDTLEPYVDSLYTALGRVSDAARSSGLEHNELWSYRIEGGRLRPTRYGTSSDIQLWSTTDLAVLYVVAGLPLHSF